MPEISVVAKNRSSFNGIDITPDTTELTGLKINTWTPPTGASYGLYISPLTGTTAKSLYLGNSIDIKNGTGTITLSVPPSTSAGYTANATHTVYLPTTGGTLITSSQIAALVSAGSTTATDLRPLDNLWTNKNTFQRTVAASLTITNATYNTLAKTYALNVEIGNDATTDPASFAFNSSAGTANTYYVAMAQMRPIPLSLAANVTVTEASTLHIMGTPSKSGIPGTAVNAYGLKISDSNIYASVPASGFANGYGLYIIQPSEATNNYALALAADNLGTNFIARFYAVQNTVYEDRVVAEFGGGNLSTTLFSFLGTTANFSIASGGTANLFAQATPKTINIGTGATANSATITIGSSAGTQGSTSVYAGTTLTLTPVSTTVATLTGIATNATLASFAKTINIGTGGAAGSITNMQFGSQVVGSTSNFTFGIASALRGSSVAKGVFAFGTSSFGAVAGSSQYSIYNLAGMANHPWDGTTIGLDVVRTTLLTNFSGLESVYTKSITTANTWVMGDGTSSIYIPQNSNCSMTIVIAANASSKGEWWEPISWKDLTSTDFTMNRNGTISLVKSSSSTEFNPTTGGSAGVMWRHGVYDLSTHWQSPPAIEANIGYGAATYPKRIHFKSKAIPSAKNITAQGTFASGAATITLSPGNTNVAVGMFVGHVSIPTGTKVAGVNTAGTSITIDQNTTAAVTSAATILFGSDNRYSKENSIAIAPSSSFYGDAPIRIKENTVLRFPMWVGTSYLRRDPAETNDGNEGNQYNGPVFLSTLPVGGVYTTNYDPYIKYHSGFATEDNANFGHAGGQWILKGNANINAPTLSTMNILQESFSGNMREGTTIGISTSYASAVPFIAITVKNRQPQKVSAFLGKGVISRAIGTTSQYRLSIVSTTPDAIRMEIPSMLAVPSTPTYTVTSSTSTSTFSVTFSAIPIKKFGSTATKNRFVATITRTSSTGTPSVSDVHTITAAGYTMTFSMPAFNWLTPGQILEVPGLPDGILVKLSDTDTSLWGAGFNPQSTYSQYYYTYPTLFNLDTVDPFWGVVGTDTTPTGGSATGQRFLINSDPVVDYGGGGIKSGSTDISVLSGGTGYAVGDVLPVYPLVGYRGYGGSVKVTELVPNSSYIKTVVRETAGFQYTGIAINNGTGQTAAAGSGVPVVTAVEFAAYNVAAVKYSATAHVTEVR